MSECGKHSTSEFCNEKIQENVLRYWVLCALEEGFLDPPWSNVTKDTFEIYCRCNRQDQFVINIILNRLNIFQNSSVAAL